MFDLEDQFRSKRTILQWCVKSLPELKLIYSEKTDDEIRVLDGKIIALKTTALPVYEAVAEAFRAQYDKSPQDDYGSENWRDEIVRGKAGDDAIHATLNQCGIFYRTDQIFATYRSDRVWHDFILSPSGIKVEIKTSDAESPQYLNLNAKHWARPKSDVVIALRYSVREDEILLEFAGWAFASEVKDFKLITNEKNPKRSYYRQRLDKLHKPINIKSFLRGIAHDGIDYLNYLVKAEE